MHVSESFDFKFNRHDICRDSWEYVDVVIDVRALTSVHVKDLDSDYFSIRIYYYFFIYLFFKIHYIKLFIRKVNSISINLHTYCNNFIYFNLTYANDFES